MDATRQQAYDRGSTIFSPDGRLYQVEYAREAVGRGSPTVGVRTSEGVALAAGVHRRSPLLEPGSVEKLHDLDGRLAVATTGHVADGRRLVDFARRYAQRERLRYGEAPGPEPVAKALGDRVQEATQTGGTRPYGVGLLLAGVIDDHPRLFEVDPSGTPVEWLATAVGSDDEAALERLESELGGAADPDAGPADEAATDDGDADERGDDGDADDADDATVPADASTGVELALRALVAGTEDEPTPESVDVVVVDAGGVERFDRERRRRALDDAGFSTAS